MDILQLYEISSQNNDLLNITLNRIEGLNYCQCDMNKLNNLSSCLDQYKNQVIIEKIPESIKLLLNCLSVVASELSRDVISGLLQSCGPK